MKRVRVGIVGFGTVGRATADIISNHGDLIEQRSGIRLNVTAVCRRSRIQPKDTPKGASAVSDWTQLVQDPNVDVVVETMGGTGESLQLLRAALSQGKPVVTANKNLLAEHGDELFALAAIHNLPIGFEASVAGGIPILRVIHESTAGDRTAIGARHTQWHSELHPHRDGESWDRVRPMRSRKHSMRASPKQTRRLILMVRTLATSFAFWPAWHLRDA